MREKSVTRQKENNRLGRNCFGMRAKNPLYNVNHKKTRIETRKHEKGKLMEKTGRLKDVTLG